MMFPILLIVIGVVNVFIAVKFLREPEFAKKYIETSPKAWLWRKLFGVEKALKITKSFFAPMGITLGAFLIVAGIGFLLVTDVDFSRKSEDGVSSQFIEQGSGEKTIDDNSIAENTNVVDQENKYALPEKGAGDGLPGKVNLVVSTTSNVEEIGDSEIDGVKPTPVTMVYEKPDQYQAKTTVNVNYAEQCNSGVCKKVALIGGGARSPIVEQRCGSDKRCFFGNASTCSLASVRDIDSATIPDLGITILIQDVSLWQRANVDDEYGSGRTILGDNPDECVLLSKVADVEFIYLDEVRQQLVDQGYSSEEIVQSSEVIESKLRAKFQDTFLACGLTRNKLTEILERDLAGDETYDLTKEGTCVGNLFDAFKS